MSPPVSQQHSRVADRPLNHQVCRPLGPQVYPQAGHPFSPHQNQLDSQVCSHQHSRRASLPAHLLRSQQIPPQRVPLVSPLRSPPPYPHPSRAAILLHSPAVSLALNRPLSPLYSPPLDPHPSPLLHQHHSHLHSRLHILHPSPLRSHLASQRVSHQESHRDSLLVSRHCSLLANLHQHQHPNLRILPPRLPRSLLGSPQDDPAASR
mmetsp:Transcript_14691/g.33001  ORF Transcript_14691/g.33001 Transcript_14691/m.33001 type:complete len:207 (+) Transcript_14691:250-870(+)